MTIEEHQAREIAEQFGRSNIEKWDEWGCEIEISEKFASPGNIVFSYPARGVSPNGKPYRIGGNVPILVDLETGYCRFEQPPWKA
ncbi:MULTISPECIES: hypothetical protein [unclassified Streptomyces]|uniref:hypothetical protein n=1 Tax=unclassified Streptomyces TaxID=2593676 RepID=UPI0013A6F9CA|nr:MULTISPECIES: hypothetical protein [unclassified Streptomyces]